MTALNVRSAALVGGGPLSHHGVDGYMRSTICRHAAVRSVRTSVLNVIGAYTVRVVCADAGPTPAPATTTPSTAIADATRRTPRRVLRTTSCMTLPTR